MEVPSTYLYLYYGHNTMGLVKMDAKTRIKELMNERGWTVYELAKRSGLSQTTLANLWKRNNEPSLPTLRTLCQAFGITLAQFFAEGSAAYLTLEQLEFLNDWNALNEGQREILKQLVKSMK